MTRLGPALGIIFSVAAAMTVAFACERDQDAPRRTLTVFAASSLSEAFHDLETAFEGEHPGIDVSIVLAGSQVLRLQIEQGAPADVFASANPHHLRALVRAGRVTDAQVFAQNELVLIVPADSPDSITSFEELPHARRIVIGTEAVPVGMYTRELLEEVARHRGSEFSKAIKNRIVSEESSVRLVRAKVELGEADAAFVYRTDAMASNDVRMISIPEEFAVRTDNLMGPVHGSPNLDLAQSFIALVRSSEGQAILLERGFFPPP